MKPHVTHEQARELLNYDPGTGVFTWKVERRMGRTGKGRLIASPGDVAGGPMKSTGYRQIVVAGRHYLEHRLAFLWMTGEWPTGQVDHLNGMRVDNRWVNLRDVSQAINTQNLRKARVDSNTGVQGVAYFKHGKRKKRFVAKVATDGQSKFLGYFATPEEAHEVYLKHKRALHVGCTI